MNTNYNTLIKIGRWIETAPHAEVRNVLHSLINSPERLKDASALMFPGKPEPVVKLNVNTILPNYNIQIMEDEYNNLVGLIKSNQMIPAIKELRNKHDFTLADAKTIAEHIRDTI